MANQQYNFELNIEWPVENNVQKRVRGAEHVWCAGCACMHGHACAGDGEGSKEQGGAGLIGCE